MHERANSISANELHELLLRSHAAGNIARRRFIDLLRSLSEQQLYRKLGYPSIVAYAESAFEAGKLSWRIAERITRVAVPETEDAWLDFAEKNGPTETVAEVRAALEKGHDKPREDRRGLPGLSVDLRLRLGADQHAVVERAFEKVAAEMGASVGGARPSPEQILLFIADRLLHTDSVAAGRVESVESPYQVIFHQCTECDRATVETGEGRVEVSEEAVARLTGSAKCVPEEERDGPNTPEIRRQLIARSGGRCENPMCGRRVGADGHGHHIVFRSHGGATNLGNLAYVCVDCHSAVHAEVLRVENDGAGGCRWTPHAADLTRRVREELAEAREIPQLVRARPVEFSAIAETDAETLNDVLGALRQLGYSAREAERRAKRAIRSAGSGTSLTEKLRAAVREPGPENRVSA